MMITAEPAESTTGAPCLRAYGRADVVVRGYLETPHGRKPCWVRDLSLGGARLETEQILASDQSVWLSLEKLKIFGAVKWVRGNLVGIQFEEKLPKTLVLNLRGEVVDPEALSEVEAMLAAQNWVLGTPTDRPRDVRIADVLGARDRRPDQPLASGVHAPEGLRPERVRNGRSSNRRAAAIIALSAAIGLLLGLGSILIF
jgi:PilZ domain